MFNSHGMFIFLHLIYHTHITNNILHTQSTFIATLLITPEMQNAMEKNLLSTNINGDRPGEAIYIRSLLEMYNQLMKCYEPMHITMLLNAIRAHGEGNWHTIDMKTKCALSDIVNFLMEEWHKDIAVMKNGLVEPPRNQTKKYMDFVHEQHGVSVLDDIFAIEMIHNLKCLQCNDQRHIFKICWQYSIPVTLHCFRYWTIDDEKTMTGTFLFVTAQQLISHPKVEDMFALVMAEEESLDEMDKVEIDKQHYIKINDRIKYGVFVSCLTKSDDMCAWTGHDWFSKVKSTLEYNQQFKYTLVFQTIANSQQITNNHYYKVEQYHIINTQTYFPKSYAYMEWTQLNNVESQAVCCSTHEIDKRNITSQHKQRIHAPQGDSVLALAEQLEFTIKHGYLQHSHCTKCNKIQPMRVLPQIYNFNKLILLHLIQYPTQYYELQWDPLSHIHGLPITQNKTQNISINSYITAKRQKEITKYGTHWRQNSRDKTWNTLNNNKFTQTLTNLESKHACLFVACRFDSED